MDSTRDASLIKGLKPHHHHLLLHSHSHFKGFTAAHVSTEGGDHDDGPVPFLTLRTLSMAFMVSMGGMMFGFDTGELSSKGEEVWKPIILQVSSRVSCRCGISNIFSPIFVRQLPILGMSAPALSSV